MAHQYNAAEVYTLSELKQFFEDDGKISALINMIVKDDPIAAHALWLQGNQLNGHKHKIVTKMPEADFRRMYQGVTPSVSGVATVYETCRQIATRFEIDVDELKMYEGEAAQSALRMQEAKRHISSATEFFVNQLFYGNSDTNPDHMRGLSARYAYKDAPNVVDFGGTTGNQCSIWAVVWGADAAFCYYPKHMKAGIEHTVLNNGTPYDAADENGKRFQVVGDEWKWNIGFTVGDWRMAARGCNIKVENLQITDHTDPDYVDLGNLTIELKNKIPSKARSRMMWYVPNVVMTAMEKQARTGKNMYLHYGQWQDSSEILKLHGKPVFECDSLSETEGVLPAMA